jgi:hypothetical protein
MTGAASLAKSAVLPGCCPKRGSADLRRLDGSAALCGITPLYPAANRLKRDLLQGMARLLPR